MRFLFNSDPGTYEVEIGRTGEKSDLLIVQVQTNTYAQVEISIVSNGLRSKYVTETI